jgi:TonB-dependent SusC/RagA subfamily outer membrane receptor
MDAIPNIPPTSVKSIEVLKGSAAAIYGTRAYGGVVLIKTKTQNQ